MAMAALVAIATNAAIAIKTAQNLNLCHGL
jgi:hypothetical protein